MRGIFDTCLSLGHLTAQLLSQLYLFHNFSTICENIHPRATSQWPSVQCSCRRVYVCLHHHTDRNNPSPKTHRFFRCESYQASVICRFIIKGYICTAIRSWGQKYLLRTINRGRNVHRAVWSTHLFFSSFFFFIPFGGHKRPKNCSWGLQCLASGFTLDVSLLQRRECFKSPECWLPPE